MSKGTRKAVIGHLQGAARQARTSLAARLLEHGFYAGQDQIMLALADADGQTPGGLAQRLGVRPPTITKTINRLQIQGFLDRRSSDSDSRQAHVFLSDTGREAIKAIEKSLRRTEKQALKGFDKKDQKALMRMLARVEANLADTGAAEIEETAEED